jgi:hypothetical protein
MSSYDRAKEFSDGDVAAGGGEVEVLDKEPVIKITQEELAKRRSTCRGKEVVLCGFDWLKEEAAIDTDCLRRCGTLEDDPRPFSSCKQ